MEKALLEVKNLSISFQMYKKGLKKYQQQTISDLSMEVYREELVAVVGSSGSGKSLLVHAIMGLLPDSAITKGSIYYDGEKLTEERLKNLRREKIAFIPQSISYLDPLIKVGKQVQGANRNKQSKKKQKASFQRYDLREDFEKLYPFQLSGGMARRVLLSMVDQKEVDFIIADEPTPGLDLEMALKTLKYFREFANQGKAVLIITHDMDLALQVADKIAIFYAGTIVEIALVSDFKKGGEGLRHPYTKALYKALPQNDFQALSGFQPYGQDRLSGCVFISRCKNADENCKNKISMRNLRGGRVRCCHAS
ncbi:ABC transporter ATP-binding protein [Garciella nitratireducens]|uniref:oligopeptide/dipeptide ABC transporter ATP-binding protein n=1 Tax=Garciella nitratireducens TaxID=218205 RepID=UPI000DEBE314|nr:ABC transporter ATP-binding protein [Garciella nitratireducens]RBP44156.1 peptide/nickel transport system ATP-binding protein [Garciella nitratireducens]